MSNRSFLGCLTAIALVVIAVIAIPVISFSNDHAYTVTITDKERVTTQVAEGDYYYCSECGHYLEPYELLPHLIIPNECPDCGAKMDKE